RDFLQCLGIEHRDAAVIGGNQTSFWTRYFGGGVLFRIGIRVSVRVVRSTSGGGGFWRSGCLRARGKRDAGDGDARGENDRHKGSSTGIHTEPFLSSCKTFRKGSV